MGSGKGTMIGYSLNSKLVYDHEKHHIYIPVVTKDWDNRIDPHIFLTVDYFNIQK